MENPRIKELTEKARNGKLSDTEKTELTGLLKPTPSSMTGMDALGAKVPGVSEKEFNAIVKEEMAKKPTTIVHAASDQLGSVPKVVELPSKNMDKYQRDVESARLNAATVPGESNEGKLPPFPIPTKDPAVTTKVKTPVVEKTPVAKATETPVTPVTTEATKSDTPKLDANEPVKDKKSFGAVLKELASKYAVPLLEILEAVGKYRGGITTPTVIEKKYADKLERDQADYVNRLADVRAAAEQERQEKLLAKKYEYEGKQADIDRLAEKEARGEELSAKEKLFKMELAATTAAKKPFTPASIIPE